VALVTDLTEIFTAVEKSRGILAIDVPIGLSDCSPRECDIEARQFLGQPRGSSVFPAPCRCCLGAPTHPEANQRNFTAAGVGLSIQCFGILRKIGDVDALMFPERQDFICEIHPEVTFALLAGLAMSHNKTTAAGIAERLQVLAANGLALTRDQIQQSRQGVAYRLTTSSTLQQPC
jgi:predicted RNase H-like nuclease